MFILSFPLSRWLKVIPDRCMLVICVNLPSSSHVLWELSWQYHIIYIIVQQYIHVKILMYVHILKK